MLPRGQKPRVSLPAAAEAGPPPASSGADRPAPGGGRAGRLRRVMRFALPVAAGLLIALAAVLIYRAVDPPPRPLTRAELEEAVRRTLEELGPEPAMAAVAYEAVRPSLVRVSVAGSGLSIGTGLIIEDTGTILTSLHVVAGGEVPAGEGPAGVPIAGTVTITFADGFETEAAVVGIQPDNDLAVLQPAIVPEELQPATLVGSAHLRVGDEVVAVGHPFGISNSVSAGVVSGLNRSFVSPQAGRTMRNLIQFDAAVNPGNSGGPLLDRNGEVVGIVTALLNPVEQEFFVGIGFAVTIETAVSGLGIPPW